MPPRLNLVSASRSLAIRSRPSIVIRQPIHLRVAASRSFASEKGPKPATGPNQDVLGHVSEEAADLADMTGETEPDIGLGTPVQEILERDPESMDKAPQVIKEEIEKSKDATSLSFDNLLALGKLEVEANGGHKFGLPTLPIPSTSNLKYRYDPIVEQVTNLIMQHGKLGVAQRNMSYILNHLRTAPPPTPSPSRPLLPGTPPATHLPLDPVLYLSTAIDSLAPLLRIRSQKGAAGGGAALAIPVPLRLKQRRRTAIMWILDAAGKKNSRGSGRSQFAQRVAEEIVGVVEGKSGAWDRRVLVHKTGTSARSNLNHFSMKKRVPRL